MKFMKILLKPTIPDPPTLLGFSLPEVSTSETYTPPQSRFLQWGIDLDVTCVVLFVEICDGRGVENLELEVQKPKRA
jgi:hypothetical protein